MSREIIKTMKTRKERDGARIRKNWRMGDGTLPTGKFGGIAAG